MHTMQSKRRMYLHGQSIVQHDWDFFYEIKRTFPRGKKLLFLFFLLISCLSQLYLTIDRPDRLQECKTL